MQKILKSSGFAENLYRIRKEKGMTQAEVIIKLQLYGSSLSVQSYSKIETGVRNIKVTDLVGLKMVFDVDYSEFFKGIRPQ